MSALAAAKQIDDDPFAGARMEFEDLIDKLRGKGALTMRHDDVEGLVAEQGREVLRLLVETHYRIRTLEEEAKARKSVKGSDGVERAHQKLRSRPLVTEFGDVEAERICFGARGHTSLAPMDAQLNRSLDMFSFRVRRSIAEAATQNSFDAVEEDFFKTSGRRVHKRQVEQLTAMAAVDFEAFYDSRPTVTTTGDHLLVLTFDQKGIVVINDALREETKKKAAERRPKLDKRRSKGEKKHLRRMSQVAAVYFLEPLPRRPEDVVSSMNGAASTSGKRPRSCALNKRVWASLERSSVEVLVEGFQEAQRRDPLHECRWVVLLDGAWDQIDTVKRAARQVGVEVTIVLDVIHVLEYLWKAGLCFFEESTKDLEDWVSERLHRLLMGQVSDVAAGIRRSATKRDLATEARASADKCADYLLNHKELLRYDEYLRDGLPISTGVIEGACRHLVRDRMDITGARWSLEGAEAVLKLRSLRSSGDFDEYWDFHRDQEQLQNHGERYANGIVPDAKPKLSMIRGGRTSS